MPTQKKAGIDLQNDIFFVSGDIDFSNVMALYKKSIPIFDPAQSLQIDFSKLTSNHSASLALMMEWLKLAKTSKKSIRFLHLPQALMSMVKAARLERLIENT